MAPARRHHVGTRRFLRTGSGLLRSLRSLWRGGVFLVLTQCSLLVDTDGLETDSDPPDAGPRERQEGGGVSDARSDSSIEAGGSCPSGRGPTMLRVEISASSAFCIDTTEVTERQYQLFLDAAPKITDQPAECAGNTSYVPSTVTFERPEDPITKVDWCDARAFCAWAGKRLCGAVGGGALEAAAVADPTKDEWMAACSRHGTRAYPYGQAYMAGACNDFTAGTTGTVPVASFASCEGGLDGLFDMAGNVSEWINACETASGTTLCMNRGASYVSEGRCNYASSDDFTGTSSDWGFRCCAAAP
jgi:formylglycine-generating enzyme